MSAIPYEHRDEEEWDHYTDQDVDDQLPGRQRRRFFTRGSAALVALMIGAIGFYAGVHVEKAHTSSSTGSGSSLPSAAAVGALSRGGASGSASRDGLPGLGAFGGANASIGTVSSVDRHTIYITDSSGNMVKVKLSSATKITKSLTVARSAVHPGDSVLIQGVKSSGGTLTATSISDSGASASSTSGSSGAGSSGGGSAVNSLFGSGSGG
jgi:hypothetical protein